MLRIIGITFDFSSIEKIEVEFSEQVRNANGITDLESILGQAKSIATSYSSTVKQALSGQEASLEFDALKQEGLNSALMNIKNSNNEEVVIDNCGINCRSKDQNDQYDQHQLRITGKNIVLTRDGFETASLAIGLMTVDGKELYGIIADVLIGDLIFGKTLHINNGKDTLTMDENGLTITNGVNTIVFDPNNTELMNVTNNDKKIFYLNELGDLFIDGNIFGGSLHLENDLGTYVDINPDKDNIIEIAKKDEESIYLTLNQYDLTPENTSDIANIVTINKITDFAISYTLNENVDKAILLNHNTNTEDVKESLLAKQYTHKTEASTSYSLSFYKDGILLGCIYFLTPVAHVHNYIPIYQDYETTNGTYYFEQNEGNLWISNNCNVSNSAATTIWTFLINEDMEYTFQYKVSSETSYDILSIMLDDVTIISGVSGNLDYKTYTTTLSSGVHTITAAYTKDYSANANDDMAYIILPELKTRNTVSHKCTICGNTEEHNYSNGVCESCNYSEA